MGLHGGHDWFGMLGVQCFHKCLQSPWEFVQLIAEQSVYVTKPLNIPAEVPFVDQIIRSLGGDAKAFLG